MDTNVTGRCRLLDFVGFPEPRIAVLIAGGLSAATKGNAIGMGAADIIPRRLADAVIPEKTNINALTGQCPQLAARPMVAANDQRLCAGPSTIWAARQRSPSDALCAFTTRCTSTAFKFPPRFGQKLTSATADGLTTDNQYSSPLMVLTQIMDRSYDAGAPYHASHVASPS